MSLDLNGMHDNFLGQYGEGDDIVNSAEEDNPPRANAYIVLVLWSCILISFGCCAWALNRALNLPLPVGRTEERDRESAKEQKRALILAYFAKSGNQMEVSHMHFEHSSIPPKSKQERNTDNDIEASNVAEGKEDMMAEPQCDEEDTRSLVLLSCGETPNVGRQPPALAPNCCAICLDAYKVKDMIVWSCTESCPHVYHRNCFNEYLVFYKGKGAPCPTCRQKFCNAATFSVASAQGEEETTDVLDSTARFSSSTVYEGGPIEDR